MVGLFERRRELERIQIQADAYTEVELGSHLKNFGIKAPATGKGVLVPCSTCNSNNECEMVMGSLAQFVCGQCGAQVSWRPRQVWLRDQGQPLEKPIHPQPGDREECGCTVL